MACGWFIRVAMASATACLCAGAGAADAALRFVAPPWPPFIQPTDSKPAGPFPDIVHAACRAIGLRCVVELYPWRRSLQMTLDGEADGLLALLNNAERTRMFHMSVPLVHTAYVLYARAGSPLRDPSPLDLAGYTVAAYGPSGTSSVAGELAGNIPGSLLKIEIDNETALRKLRVGRYGDKAVVVINQELGAWMMRNEGAADLKPVGEVRKITYHIGMSRTPEKVEARERFLAALDALVRDGTVHAIAARYGMKGVQ